MVIYEPTVRPMDGLAEHPRTDLLRVGERMPWFSFTIALRFLVIYKSNTTSSKNAKHISGQKFVSKMSKLRLD
jgi:hypothetical protein